MSRKTRAELDADAARKRDRRARFEREGLCNVCGKEKPAPERKACEICLEASSERTMKCWNENDGWTHLQEKQAKRRKQGLCRCGRKPLRGLSKCRTCKERE